MKKSIFHGFFNDLSDEGEDRTKFIQKRINIVQKYVPLVNAAFSDFVNKTVNLTNSGEKIVSALERYAQAEDVTTSVKEQISHFANVLHTINAKRNRCASEIETKIVQELSEYGKICKHVQSELKYSSLAYDKEKIRLKQLRRAREDQVESQQLIALAEDEYVKASIESSKCLKSLEEQIDILERRKLNSFKDVLTSWAVAEIRFHAKALELFTEAYNVAAGISVESDMEEFRNKLRTENSPTPLDSSRELSSARSQSLMQILSKPFNRRCEKLTGIGIPHPSPSSNLSSAVGDSSDRNHSSIF